MSEDWKERRRREIIESGEVKYDYIKSNYFRVIHVDGAWGGLTPRLGIRMVIFNERGAIPTQTVQAVSSDGTIGEEIFEKRTSRDAIVREVEADLVMDLATANVLVTWLQDKINQLQTVIKEQTAKKEG